MMARLRELSITSRHNDWFKRFRQAAARHDREVIVEGRKQVEDVVAAGLVPIAVASASSFPALAPQTLRLKMTPELIAAISATETAQGVIALIERPATKLAAITLQDGPLVVLDGVQDPGNVGTIIRLAVAFEAAAVILLEGCADPWSPKVIRAAVGSIFLTQIVETSTSDFLAMLEREHLPLYATAMKGRSDFAAVERKCAIVFGSEGRGVSAPILEAAESLTIPMSNRVESLNVAAAAAIILSRLYERR